jgi:hypothetical protein
MPDGDEVIRDFDENTRPLSRRAGLRPDERDPDEAAHGPGEGAGDRHMQGAAAGGSAVGGLAGTNSGDGSTDDVDIERGHGIGFDDHTGDRDSSESEPTAGISGGDGGTVGSPPEQSPTPY